VRPVQSAKGPVQHEPPRSLVLIKVAALPSVGVGVHLTSDTPARCCCYCCCSLFFCSSFGPKAAMGLCSVHDAVSPVDSKKEREREREGGRKRELEGGRGGLQQPREHNQTRWDLPANWVCDGCSAPGKGRKGRKGQRRTQMRWRQTHRGRRREEQQESSQRARANTTEYSKWPDGGWFAIRWGHMRCCESYSRVL